MEIAERSILTPQHQQFYQDNGYVVVSGLFSDDEVAGYREHYMTLRQSGPFPGDTAGVGSMLKFIDEQ